MITQFFFEHFKIPAFCLMDAAVATLYAYSVPSATIIDVGHGKFNVSAISEFVAQPNGRGLGITGFAGEQMTSRLYELLGPKGFDYDMCEQLKKSGICEILQEGASIPGKAEVAKTVETNPAAAASTGATGSGPDATEADGKQIGQAPRGPGIGTEVGDESREDVEDNEGVLDVASIVARGDASEFIAKREREKAEKAAAAAAAKKGASAAEPPKPTRLRNSEKEKASFQYEDYVPVDDGTGNGTQTMRKRKRDIEVGPERFLAATPFEGTDEDIFDVISASVYIAIFNIEPAKRGELWENIIICGNGSRVKGNSSIRFSCTPANSL